MADKRPPAQPTSSPAPAARSYTDDELIRRTEEFNRAAELYWQRVRDDPSGLTAESSKRRRREKNFVDHMRNARGATVVAS